MVTNKFKEGRPIQRQERREEWNEKFSSFIIWPFWDGVRWPCHDTFENVLQKNVSGEPKTITNNWRL